MSEAVGCTCSGQMNLAVNESDRLIFWAPTCPDCARSVTGHLGDDQDWERKRSQVVLSVFARSSVTRDADRASPRPSASS